MQNKDNPVPSLDKIIGVIYEEHYEMHRRGAYDFPNKKRWVKNQIKRFKLNNPDLLQNGVETNKEQPKYLVMHSNYPIAFCSNKKKFLKEEMLDDEERELTEFIPIKLGNID